MHKPTVIKLVIGVILIVAVVAATFWYGNMQRTKQTQSNQPSSGQNQATNQNPQTTPSQPDKPSDKSGADNKNQPTQQTTPSPTAPAPVTPSPQSQTNMPTTGGETSIIPLTILSTLGYMYWRSRQRAKLYK